MDKIFLNGLKAQTLIGVYDWERQHKQTVVLDLTISLPKRDVNSHDIASTIHYGEVCEQIRAQLAQHEFQLIERLAEHIAQFVLQQFNAAAVKLRVMKQGILSDVREVGVEIERNNIQAA